MASSIVALAGCANPVWRAGGDTTTIAVQGPAGSGFFGSYVQDGIRTPISGRLPFTFTHERLQEFDLFKSDPQARVDLAAQNDERGWHSEVMSAAVSGVYGLRLVVDRGLLVEKVKTPQPPY